MRLVSSPSSNAPFNPLGYVSSTIADLDYYINTLGDDTLGDGSLANPYRNIQKVIDILPDQISHNVNVHASAGVFSTPTYISKLYNTSGAVKYLNIIGEKTILQTELTVTSKLGKTLTVAGAGWTPNAFVGKQFVVTSGAGYSSYELPLAIVSNTNDTLTFAFDTTAYNNTTKFTIYEPATTISNQIQNIGSQQSMEVVFKYCNIGGTNTSFYTVTARNSYLWFVGCSFDRKSTEIGFLLVDNATVYTDGCFFNGTSSMSEGGVILATPGSYYIDRNGYFTGFTTSNRQGIYVKSGLATCASSAFIGNYYGVRGLRFSAAELKNDCILTNNTYAIYAQRGADIDASTALGSGNTYLMRVADGGQCLINSTRVGYTTDIAYLDSAGGSAIDMATKYEYSKDYDTKVSYGTDYPIPVYKSGLTFMNSAVVKFTLPPAETGLFFKFIVNTANYLRIDTVGNDFISNLGVNGNTPGYMRSNVEGSVVKLEAVSATEWRVAQIYGTWTYDA